MVIRSVEMADLVGLPVRRGSMTDGGVKGLDRARVRLKGLAGCPPWWCGLRLLLLALCNILSILCILIHQQLAVVLLLDLKVFPQ